jgi:23S rRNA (cytidine1920-2'-O)/16S rRNA (cytidine1409-2'-O)-methyltransferase
MVENQYIRLDQHLVDVGLAESRNKAVWMIEKGWVKVNGKVQTQKSIKIQLNDQIEIHPDRRIYVSQGGYKLEKAIHEFKLDLGDKTVLDIGASTGGFSDCALQHGAKLVVAIDIGEGQLHKSLIEHAGLISLEKTDIRTLDPSSLPIPTFDFILVDVSFISLEFVFPYLKKFQQTNTQIITLLKPQFEQVERRRYKHGIIKSEKVRLEAIAKIEQHIFQHGYKILGMVSTDADGKEKNVEYLLLLSPAN